MSKFRVASFFAGVGGIDLGFEQTNKCTTIYANEFDEYPVKTFESNFNIKVDCRDIKEVKEEEVPIHDIMIGGFPCQAFSIAGYRQGFDDEKGRGALFFELVRMMKYHKPRVALFENVKNLVGHDNGNTFRVICSELDKLGYKYIYQVLNGCDFGNVPQNRERIYIICFREPKDYANFKMILPITLTKTVDDVIDFDAIVDDKYYYSNKHPHWEEIKSGITKEKTIYQWRRKYVRENKSDVVPCLTRNMGGGGDNVPLILTSDKRIRKLTPRECFNVQGFPQDFILPELSNTRLYQQAGNSVVVPVIHRLAEEIIKALEV